MIPSITHLLVKQTRRFTEMHGNVETKVPATEIYYSTTYDMMAFNDHLYLFFYENIELFEGQTELNQLYRNADQVIEKVI